VVKIPRLAFESSLELKPILGTQMKSVGETMAMDEPFRKRCRKTRGLEIGRRAGHGREDNIVLDQVLWRLKTPNPERNFLYQHALQHG